MIRIAGIIYLFIICCVFPAQLAHSETQAEKGRAIGQQAGSQVKSEIGSTDQIQSRISNPLTSDDKPLQTFAPTYETTEQTVSFSGQLTAPSSNAFVEIFAQPSSSGDLAGVYVKQDTNFDNTVDYVYNLSVQVSGVCANGIISCDAGTWNNCSYYKWTADDEAKVSLATVSSITDLAACYCVNNHCGGNLVWNNMNIVLKDLGGGVVSAIHTRDPQYTITNVSTDGPVIKYYGQKTSEQGTGFSYQTTPPNQEADGVYLSGNLSPEQYYQGGMGTLPVDDEVASQSVDTNSYHSMLVDSFSAQPNVTHPTCVIANNLSIITETGKHGGGTIKIESTTDNAHEVYLDGTLIWTNGDWTARSSGTFNLPDGTHAVAVYAYNYDTSSPAGLILSIKDAYGQVLHNTQGSGGWKYTKTNPGAGWTNPDFDNSSWSNMTKVADFGHAPWGSIGGWQDATADWIWWNSSALNGSTNEPIWVRSIIPFKTDSNVFTTNNQCDFDSSCRLKEEKVCDDSGMKCIQTWRNFSPTGLSPFPICKQITSDIEIYTACMDGNALTLYDGSSAATVLSSGENMWWRIDRVYECESDNQYDLSDAMERSKHITGSVQDNTTSMHYEDYNTDTGETTTYNVDLLDMGTYENCEKACKVRKPLPDTDAGVSGTTNDYRTTTASYVDEYRPCNNNVCPVAAGETILKNCACLNDFAEATSTMQVLSNAGKDLVCSEN